MTRFIETTDKRAVPLPTRTTIADWARPDVPPSQKRGVPRIAIGKNAVKVRGETLPGEVWWQGVQWAVTERGIECRDGCYYIAKDRLLEGWRERVHCWPEHLAEKAWVDIDDFATAWLVALLLHDHDISTVKDRKSVV